MSNSKKTLTSSQSFTDVMVISGGHSLMVSHVPEKVASGSLSDNFYKATKKDKESIERFGMWGGSLNFNSFSPEVTPEMLKPKDEEFIEPMFRMLSSTVVSKNYNPTYFSDEVLKESMPLLVGQTINLDHDMDVGNAIGAVKSVEWQDSYEVDGIVIPSGINGIFKIDGMSNPRIARGIMMDPPSIHSNSVTVEFEWEPSHKFNDIWEFYDKMGTYDEEGKLICRIATKIISYKETSLVWHGADPYAQKIVDGVINNIQYAHSQGMSLSEDQRKFLEDPHRKWSQMDYKDIKSNLDTPSFSNRRDNQMKPQIQNINNMNEQNQEIKAFLESIFGGGYLTLEEGKEKTLSQVLSQVKATLGEVNSLKESIKEKDKTIAGLNEEISNLKNEVSESASFKEKAGMYDKYIESYRESVIANYTKLMGDKVDDNIVSLLKEASVASLEALNKSYTTQLEEKFPLHCNHCGSKDISRASSVEDGKDDENQFKEKTVKDAISNLANSKLK